MILRLTLITLLIVGATSVVAQTDSKPPESTSKLRLLPRLSLKEVESKVRQLKQEDVAWRKIDWKTCLLDGLRASREQKKPIILWIFIDRPKDDERC